MVGPLEEPGAGQAGGPPGVVGGGLAEAVVEEVERGPGPGGDVADGAIDGRAAPDLAEHRDVAGEDQGAAGEGLDHWEAEPFGLARLEHQRGPAVHRREHGGLLEAEEGERHDGVSHP